MDTKLVGTSRAEQRVYIRIFTLVLYVAIRIRNNFAGRTLSASSVSPCDRQRLVMVALEISHRIN